MVMIMVNIHEVKAKLSEYLDAALRGEQVVICKRNQPLVELRVIAPRRTEPRPLGLASGMITIPDAFFDPMPDDWLDEMEKAPVFPATGPRRSRVAEDSPAYGAPATDNAAPGKRRRRVRS
jgi:prevent-host-death family protein